LLWNFTALGEAANQVSDELKLRHSELPWQQPTRLRNRIVHGHPTRPPSPIRRTYRDTEMTIADGLGMFHLTRATGGSRNATPPPDQGQRRIDRRGRPSAS
jgi:hypothetical protein